MIEFCFPMKYNANKIVIPVIKMSFGFAPCLMWTRNPMGYMLRYGIIEGLRDCDLNIVCILM